MRILFANHTGAWSGAEVSLMRVLAGVRAHHEVCVACPRAGLLSDALAAAGVARRPLPEVGASLRLHPLRTPLGLGQLAAGGVALAGAARDFRADVIHANSTRAGILASIARALGGPAFVVRAHEHVPLTPVGRAVRALLVRSAGAIAAVSDYTAFKFNEGLERPVATRIYNSIDHARFDPSRVRPAALRDELGLSPGAYLLGQVAQITPWKGQDTLIRALPSLRSSGFDAHLVFVGHIAFGGAGVRYDNHAYRRDLAQLTEALGLEDSVHFLGQREDVPQVVRALDLSLLPSWEEPFGLVTVESMALGIPPLVSSVGAGPELVEDRATGRVLPPWLPEEWAKAAGELLSNPRERARMGARGPAAAQRFRDELQAAELLAVYRQLAGGAGPSSAGEGRGCAAAWHRDGSIEERVEAGWRS
jgi:glycosyltransferase involved in cell wall biosynthesis